MKYISFFFTFLSLFTLYACSLNTKFDDDKYRPVGASTPVNSKTQTLSETHRLTVEKKAEDELESVSTRYIRPDSENSSQKETTKNTIQTTKTSANDTNKDNIITRTINKVFNSRYGDSDIITTIAKTVHIHCDQINNKPLADKKPLDSSPITVCEYQFPKYCGAHIFSLLSNKNKQLLMFHEMSYQRKIIDTISGNKHSAPGLWDEDDYVSSNLLTVRQLINNKSINTNDLGWIMTVSDNEKAQLGRSYLAAINEAGKCF